VEASFTFFKGSRPCNALFEMPLHQHFSKRLQGTSCGYDLIQDIGAISFNAEHSFDRTNLAGNFSQPELERFGSDWIIAVVIGSGHPVIL
jgi:hypothetical protein